MATATDNRTEAPVLKPFFGNPITTLILSVVVGLILSGLVLIFRGVFWGVLIAFLGVIFWKLGDTKLETDPRTAGILTFWGVFITYPDGEPMVVGGRTILADYFPFFIGVTEFEITNADKDFPMTILSSDNVSLKGVVSLTLIPNPRDAIDYIQAGKMKEIFPQLDDIVYEKSKTHGRVEKAENIAKQSELISGPLRADILNVLETRSFGVLVLKIQARFDMPKEVLDRMQQTVIEGYDRKAEKTEYATDLSAARKLMTDMNKDPNKKEHMTLNQALQEIKTLRLIRDGRVARIEGSGGVGSVALVDAKLNMGGEKKGDK